MAVGYISAEIRLNLFAKQCLNRRMSDLDEVRTELIIWCKNRNRQSLRVNWQFTMADARDKLGSLYPKIANL